MVAERSITEILKRFEKRLKIQDLLQMEKIVTIIKSFLKINCKLSELDEKLLDFARKNDLKKNILKILNLSLI